MHPHHFLRRGEALLRRPGRLSLVALAFLALWPGCSQPESRVAVTPVLVEEGPRELRILRADYEAVIKEGLQPIMRWYLTMPAYDAVETFLGFRIVRILRDDMKDGPVKVGDVLRRINGQPIETPGQVEAVWRELWSRKILTLSLIREGRPMDLTIPIVTPDADPSPAN
ncbi:MAG: hypothetical protein ABIK09_16360 [Pseudomonadota bacterium]